MHRRLDSIASRPVVQVGLAGTAQDIGGEFAAWLVQQRERRRSRMALVGYALMALVSVSLLAGWTEARVMRTGHALRSLVKGAPELHAALAEEAGVGHLIERRGLLYIYPTRADFEAEALAWRVRRETGPR